MNRIVNVTLLLMLVCHAAPAQFTETLDLLPVPGSMQLQNGSLAIGQDFMVSVQTNVPDTILIKAVNRMYQALNRRTGLYFTQERIRINENGDSAVLLVRVKQTVLPAIGVDESYALKVSADKIVIDAVTTAGALHGLQTLLQLCTKNGSSYAFPLIDIKDSPRFSWRGLMIDVSRHFVPMDVLERNIESMEAVKMNVLHLHLTDDQGFRIESKVYPKLQQKGSNGEYYTQARLKELISFARDRGIEIVPEFDMPGHTTSWFAGYPQLASAPGPYQPGSPFDLKGNHATDLISIMKLIQTAPTPAMDPTKESTYAFLDKFIKEMTTIFPTHYMHIGADEVNGVAWKNNPAIMAFMQKNKMGDVHALQAYFVSRVQKILQKNNKLMIGWEELFSKELPKDVTVQVWQNAAYLNKALENGNPVLISQGFYLDMFMPAYIHYGNTALPSENKPSTVIGVKGGEAAQWTELADKFNIETRIWPRAAAIAERLWSPEAVKNVDDMYRRLFVISHQLDGLGLCHIVNYERSLRLYANDEDFYSLKSFTDILTPVKGYKKLFARFFMSPEMAYQTAPLIEVSDFVFVDSEVKWRFRAAVRSYLQQKDAPSEKIINYYLALWQNNDKNLEHLLSNSGPLKRVSEHSRNLSLVATLGKTALEKIKTGETPSGEWINECMAVLKNAGQSYGETELDIIPEVESLIRQQMVLLPAAYSPF
jgi:hexosaminidase